MKAEEIETGKTYRISGDLENGFMNGKPCIEYETVSRKITRVTDTYIICECGRKFLNNENLYVEDL